MKKSLIALAVATSISAFSAAAAPVDKDGHYLNTAKDLIGSLSYTDKQEYIEQFKTFDTKQEQAAFFKMLIVAETSVENAINFALNGENGAVVEAFMIESGLLKENENGRLVIQEESDAYIALSAKRSELFGKHVQYDDNDDFYISPIVDDNERQMPDVGVSPIDVVITPVEPVTTEKKVEIVNQFFTAAGLDSTIDGTTITFVSPSTGITTSYDLATLTTEQLVELKAEAKSVFKQGIDDRRVNAPIVEPIDPGFGIDPIDVVIDPIDPGFGVDPIDVVIEPIDPGFGVDPIDVVIEPIDPGFGVDPIDVVIEPIDPGFGVDPIDVIIDPIDPGFGVDPIDVVIEPIDPGFDVDPIAPTPETAKEFKEVVDASIGEGTVDAYLAADTADKEVLAQDILASDGAESLKNIMIPNPAYSAASDAPKQISLHDYLSDVADPEITPPVFDVESGELVLKNAGANLQIAGDNLYLYGKNLVTELTKHEQAQLDRMDKGAQALTKLNEIQNQNIINNTDDIGALIDGLKVGKDAASQALTALNDIQNQNIINNTDDIGALTDGLKVAKDVASDAMTGVIEDLQAQIDRLNSGDDGTNPPVQDVELREGLQAAGAELAIKGADARAVLEEHEQAQIDYMKASNAALGNDIQSNQIAIVALADNDIAQNERMDTAEDVLVSSATDMKVSLTNQFASIDSSIQVVANSAANNSVLIADVTATQSVFNVALQEASQTLQAKTGKAVQVLETARNGMQSGVNELHIAADSMKTSLTTELADLQAQIDRLNSGDDGTNPPTVDEELRAGLVIAKDKVETELAAVNGSIDIVANSAANNSMLIATNSANQAGTNDALQSAGQELQAKTGKAVETLETARSGMNAGANELMAALQSMQAQMDAQARLIAELQAGENPGTGLPTSIDQDVRDGLQTASATMQKKLGKAADMLKTASNGLKNNKPEYGVQPIQPTEPVEPITPFDPRDHEYGSVGNGAATAWLNERIDTGKGLMNEHLDAEFMAFEDKITAMYQSDMASFQEDVQDEMDGVMASTHAITNSRPFLSNGGTAIGVGIGAAGDASAVAIGVAHSFVDTGWSVSGSVNATTGSSSDVSLGAGVQYQF